MRTVLVKFGSSATREIRIPGDAVLMGGHSAAGGTRFLLSENPNAVFADLTASIDETNFGFYLVISEYPLQTAIPILGGRSIFVSPEGANTSAVILIEDT